MPGRIGPSPETPSPYLPDPDQRLPGFARAALLKNMKNFRSCNPGNSRKDRPKKDFFQLPVAAAPLGRSRGCYDGSDFGNRRPRAPGPNSSGHRIGRACFHLEVHKFHVNLHVSTYNIHKGFSQFNRRMMIRELRDHLQLLGADIIFLQEVQGRHSRHAARFEDWPEEPQYEFLADQVWPDFAYGRNAVYDHGHHGNAILSRYPILRAENEDVSHHALERRGMLHCEIELPEIAQPLHCICVHLALHERGRRHQVGAIIDRLNREVPGDAPVVVAGDFNDWRNRAGKRLEEDLGLEEACRDHRGKPERTFPSSFPVLRLDRIYVRGFRVRHTHVHHGPMWRRLSDHAALSAHLQLE